MNVGDVVPKMTAILQGAAAEGVAVVPTYADAVSPPAYMVLPGTPWLDPMTQCNWWARFDVLCIAHRVDPTGSLDVLTSLVANAVDAFRADDGSWPMVNVTAPRFVLIAATTYLACRVSYRVPVTIEGG